MGLPTAAVKTADDRRLLVERVMFCAQKARSGYHEFTSGMEPDYAVREQVLADTQKYLADGAPLNLITACERVLAGGREVQPIDVFNILTLAHKTETVAVAFTLIQEEELPQPMQALA